MSDNSTSNKRIAKNTMFLYVRMMITMIISLYTSRVILQVLGVDDYGIYQAVGGIVGFMSFINNALGTGSSRFITFGLGEGNEEKLKNIEDSRALYENIKKEGECVSLKKLAVNGKDLIALGVTPGKRIGEVLGAMLEDVIDEPSHNTKEYLLDSEQLKKFF